MNPVCALYMFATIRIVPSIISLISSPDRILKVKIGKFTLLLYGSIFSKQVVRLNGRLYKDFSKVKNWCVCYIGQNIQASYL